MMINLWGMRFALVLLGLAWSIARAGDWPQFLGPSRSGVAAEDEYVEKSFPATGAKVLWSHPLGTGFAGPSVASGKVVAFHRVEGQVLVECLDAVSGEELWHYTYKNAFKDSFGFDNGPRACPTIADNKVVVHGAEGALHVLDLATGNLLWSSDTAKEFNSPEGFFGRVSAPLFEDGKVILAVGGRSSKGAAGLVAFNAADGKVVWQSIDDEAGYAAPILRKDGPWPALICWMRNQLVVTDANTGSVKFEQRLRSDMDASVNAATPIWCGDRLFLSACYDVGASLWNWNSAGKLTRIWRKDDVLDCHYSTPVHREGYLYGFHGRQEFGQSLRCVRVEDGKVMWESGRLAGGTLILVQDTLLVLTEAGELWLVDASPEKFNRRAQEQILRAGHRSNAAISNGIYFARDGHRMVAIDLRAKSR